MTRAIGKDFMALTKYRQLGPSDQMRGRPAPPLEAPYDESAPAIPLPPPAELGVSTVNLRELIDQRRSTRVYAPEPLSLAELSYLLWCTQGVKESEPGVYTLRTVPSAGARHALETYLLINRVENVAPGLYRFLATRHALQAIPTAPGVAERLVAACLGQDFVAASAAT